MCRLNSRLLVALLTFVIGVTGVYLWFINSGSVSENARWQSHSLVEEAQDFSNFCLFNKPSVEEKIIISKYDHPAFTDGLFYLETNDGALVLSFDNQPIPPKENDPDAPKIPGFYNSEYQKFDFEKVEIIKNKVYFKTYSIDGISYEFKGTSQLEHNPDYDKPISHIKGSLQILENGKVITTRKIEFSHAVSC